MADPLEPVLDVQHLSLMTGADASLGIEIIDIFRHQTDMWQRMLDPSLPRGQWADAAHSLKGTALSVGAKRLAAACAEVETLGRSSEEVSVVEAGTMISALKDEIGPAIEAAARVSHQLTVKGAYP
ncbi:MAG: Hpt domain-containing protein [Hyphomonadaceae bacterium]